MPQIESFSEKKKPKGTRIFLEFLRHLVYYCVCDVSVTVLVHVCHSSCVGESTILRIGFLSTFHGFQAWNSSHWDWVESAFLC